MHETVLVSSILAILKDTVAQYEERYEENHETCHGGCYEKGDWESHEAGHSLPGLPGRRPEQHPERCVSKLNDLPESSSLRPRYLQIEEVVLHVGVLACVEPQTLRGCFEIMAEGTAAENATLTITTQPMKGLCPDCGRAVETSKRAFACPLCQGEHVDWQGGQGMEITSIRVREKALPQSIKG